MLAGGHFFGLGLHLLDDRLDLPLHEVAVGRFRIRNALDARAHGSKQLDVDEFLCLQLIFSRRFHHRLVKQTKHQKSKSLSRFGGERLALFLERFT